LRLLTEGQRLTEAQEAQLLGLASVLAERLIGEQLRVSPATISRLAEEVLREARGARKITIFCAPDAKASLLSAAPRLAEVFASTIDVQQDASLGEGDLIIESELGQIVAKIRSRLDCLLAVLRGREGQ
jgi:flagellar biosynthesis/type III secretory pathway protein FliH